MHEHHCHRHGHPAGAHVSSSRDTSMVVAYTTTMTVFRNTGFWTIHQRPRGATS